MPVLYLKRRQKKTGDYGYRLRPRLRQKQLNTSITSVLSVVKQSVKRVEHSKTVKRERGLHPLVLFPFRGRISQN